MYLEENRECLFSLSLSILSIPMKVVFVFLFVVLLANANKYECNEIGYEKYLDLYPFKRADSESYVEYATTILF